MRSITFAAIVLAAMSLGACSGPLWQFPGGALDGKEQALHLATLPETGGVIQLETNPDKPYSVNVGTVFINGALYIDPAESRTWYQNIKANPNVRIRLEGSDWIHPAFAVEEKDPAVLERFDADRIVLRLMPKP